MRVSCLMVTQPGREHLADQALDDFARQTWPDRELFFVCDRLSSRVGDHYNEAKERALAIATTLNPDHRVRIVCALAMGQLTLGALRNMTTEMAKGSGSDVWIQWDDDDRYHPDRVRCQVEALSGQSEASCSCLTAQLYFFTKTRELYWVDWTNRRPKYSSVLIPGTIAVRAEVGRQITYPETGPTAAKGEDGAYLERALDCGPCVSLDPGQGHLYVRRCHGANTWSTKRFLANARWLGWTRIQVNAARREIDAVCSGPTWATGGPIRVMGTDGEAFVFTPHL